MDDFLVKKELSDHHCGTMQNDKHVFQEENE